MCGTPLPSAYTDKSAPLQPAKAVSTSQPATVAGPSFLGLTEPAGEPGYLYEDAPQPRHRLAYVALLLVLAAGALLAWTWGQQGQAWHAIVSVADRLGGSNNQTTAIAPVEDQSKSTQEATVPIQPTPTPTPAAPAAESSQPYSGKDQLADRAKGEDMNTSGKKLPSDTYESEQAALAPAGHSSDEHEQLVSEGENYLYGNGVPVNCDLARSKLFVAAEKDNAEAQRLLGAMFATGHCVSVDLPAAYHWLAVAERHSPRDARLSANLRMVWREMSPQQQETAVRASR